MSFARGWGKLRVEDKIFFPNPNKYKRKLLLEKREYKGAWSRVLFPRVRRYFS